MKTSKNNNMILFTLDYCYSNYTFVFSCKGLAFFFLFFAYFCFLKFSFLGIDDFNVIDNMKTGKY